MTNKMDKIKITEDELKKIIKEGVITQLAKKLPKFFSKSTLKKVPKFVTGTSITKRSELPKFVYDINEENTDTKMAKIRITENELKQIIRESVENVLNEMDEGAWDDLKRAGKNWLKAGGNAATNAVQGGLRTAKGGLQAAGGAIANTADRFATGAGNAMRSAGARIGNATRTAGTKVRNAGDVVQGRARQIGATIGAAKDSLGDWFNGKTPAVTPRERVAKANDADQAQIAARNAALAQRNAQATANANARNAARSQGTATRVAGRNQRRDNTLAQARGNFQQARQNWNNFVNEDNEQ